MTPSGELLVHPIRDEALGNTSYLVEVGDGIAISIDPRRDIDEHLALATRRGLTIRAALETHLHADFVSGSREIAAATGAQIVAAAEAGLRFAHRGVTHGEELPVGRASVTALATPGHTSEHLSYLVSLAGTRALFSGGSLIVGGAARTDLTGAGRTLELARAQFRSLRRLAGLPDDTQLHPTHGAGSFCTTGPARSASSTIGAERAANPLLSIDDEDTFVRDLLSSFGSYPRYFAKLGQLNREGATVLGSSGSLPELDGARAQAAVVAGAWLIDGRPIDRWAAAHAEGSVSIEVRAAFPSWLGWVVPFGEPVVFVLEPEQVSEAVRLAGRIGYDRLEGWLRFGSWREAGLPVSSVEMVRPSEAARRVENGAVLVDVRQASEFAGSHIPGAMHLELGDVIEGKGPDAADVVTYCGHGERSATAASLLAHRGMRVANLAGGSSAWSKAGYPLGA